MDGRGGCCIGISRYGGGVYDMSKVDRIMLRFRPIAPKPAAGGSASGGHRPEKADACVKSGRGKRRYARDNSNSNNNNNNNIVNSKRCNRKRKASPEEKVVTLPLLPEAPDRRDSPERGSPGENREKTEEMGEELNVSMWLSFDGNNKVGRGLGFGGLSDRMEEMTPAVWVVGSCVIVECVMDTWVDGDGLGRTDEERRTTLRRDTCPGFVTDGLGRVTWTNEAYRSMVDHPPRNQDHLAVWLVMKEETAAVPSLTHSAFTCRVRVVQYDAVGKERSSLTLPCDVWRMDGGGFAWRLDVKAALCLGR